MALSLLFHYYYTWSWDSHAQKLVASLSTPLWIKSMTLCNPLSRLVVKETKTKLSLVAETIKLPANSSYRCQTVDRSRHSVTSYMNDEKTLAAINDNMFKCLGHINDQPYEVEVAKPEIEQKESIKVGVFILQYAKLRTLDLYCNFFLQTFAILSSKRRWKWMPIHCL